MSESEEKPQLKIRCPNCQRRLDVTLLEPFSVFNCPECGNEVTVPKWWHEYVFESRVAVHEGVELYRALDTALDREVLVELVTNAGGYSEASLEDYLSTIRRAAAVNDPALSSVYGCGRYEEGVYAVFQYLPEALNVTEPQSWNETLSWLKPVLNGLGKAAAEQLYHGRLGLAFLRRTESGGVCVSGFGVGMSLENRMVHDGYESPERLSGGEASLTGDIYSLGKIVWRCLSGKLPEEGGLLGPDVPADVSALLREMTSLSPLDRPQSYEEILSRLDGAKSPASSKKVMKLGGSGFQGKVKVPRRMSSTAMPMPQGGGNHLVLVIFLLLLVVAGILGFLVWKRQDGASAPSAGTASAASTVQAASSESKAETEQLSRSSSVASSARGEKGASLSSYKKRKDLFKQSHKLLPQRYRQARPRPASPLLHESKAFRKYVAGLPKEYRDGVETRANLIEMSKDLLASCTAKNKYDRGSRTRLMLADGREIHATIRMSNPNGLSLGPVRGRKDQSLPRKRVRLEDLHWVSYIELMDYYGDYRYKRLPSDKKSPEYQDAYKDLVHHYIILILLCDWYDQRPEMKRYVKRCLDLEPKSRIVLEKYGIPVTD